MACRHAGWFVRWFRRGRKAVRFRIGDQLKVVPPKKAFKAITTPGFSARTSRRPCRPPPEKHGHKSPMSPLTRRIKTNEAETELQLSATRQRPKHHGCFHLHARQHRHDDGQESRHRRPDDALSIRHDAWQRRRRLGRCPQRSPRGRDYPDAADSTDRVSFTFNRQGEPTTKTDQNGTVHEYARDRFARPTSDTITTLGAGVNGTVFASTRPTKSAA